MIDDTDFSSLNVKVLVRVSKDQSESFENLYNVVNKSESVMLKECNDEQD